MGYLQRIFGRKTNKGPNKIKNMERVEVMNGSPPCFTPFSGDAYESDIYRLAVRYKHSNNTNFRFSTYPE